MSAPHLFTPGPSGFTILTLHETGADEHDLPPVARAVAPGAAVLSPRLSDEMTLSGLAAWIASSVAEYALNPAQVYLLGYSSGADIGAELLLQHPGLLAGGILLRPGTLARPAMLPPLENVAVLIVAGTQDNTHLPDHAVAVARLLAEAGAQVDFSEHAADHGLTPHDFALGKQWLAQQFQRAPVQR